MRKFYTVILVALTGILFATAHASSRSPVYFKAPMKFRGTGCPGANSITVSGEDATTMTVVFDQFDAARPKDNAASGNMRSSCSFVVPVHVPQGLQVSTMTADWRGYAEGKTKLHREYFFAGQRGPSKTSKPEGDFTLTDDLMHAIWSDCKGRDVPMRINSSVQATSNNSYIAIKKMAILKLKWRKCLGN